MRVVFILVRVVFILMWSYFWVSTVYVIQQWYSNTCQFGKVIGNTAVPYIPARDKHILMTFYTLQCFTLLTNSIWQKRKQIHEIYWYACNVLVISPTTTNYELNMVNNPYLHSCWLWRSTRRTLYSVWPPYCILSLSSVRYDRCTSLCCCNQSSYRPGYCYWPWGGVGRWPLGWKWET